ncbi:choice-of-anchor I family protein [Synechococcus sp. CCY 9618]|uniref:choice-of-anchor I family protein n=1 Tax=Synechococcus sp. CCY 9618 TaxID=2815602 RepID=UPI0021137A20|nr:choice-of-anchor I family protein [Synechococcus sp. CCY 9618]
MVASSKAKGPANKWILPEELTASSQAYVGPAAPAVANRKAFPGRPEPAPAQPLLGRLDLSPQATTGEQFQSEISTTVSIRGQMFVVSSGGGGTLQVTNATDPAAITLEERVTLTGFNSQSVASFGNLLAVALSPSDYASNGGKGVIRFYRVGAEGGLTFLQDVQVGYLPDSIAFNDKGNKLVIANEGEPITGYGVESGKDPVGSIGIIDIKGQANLRFSYTELDFAGLTLPAGLRISGPAGTTQATDIEPEYVSILGNYAYVTLQENNGVAKVNLKTNSIETIFALGAVDFKNQLVDLTDRDNPTGSTSLFKPLLGQNYEGLRMADGIAAYSVKGKDYFVTANEGDGREYTQGTAPDVVVTYTDEARGSGNANRVRRLTDDATAGSPDRITTFGGRSISLFDADTGALLWDSGNTLQTIAVAAGMYADGRSDDKGVEPEMVVVAQMKGRSYAIVSMERTSSSMLAVFDVTDPAAVNFVTSTVIAGSISPEGLHIVEAKQSPTGRSQLIVSNEVSNTLDVFDLEALIAAPPVAGAGTFASTMIKDVAGGPELSITSLITNGEFTNGFEPGSVYAPPGIFDGIGAYDNGDGTYSVLVNSELGNTVGYGYTVDGVNLTGARVSKFIVDKDVDDNADNGYQSAVISGGIAYSKIYDVDGMEVTAAAQINGGFSRFCSSSFEQAGRFEGRGFVDAIYLTGEESDEGLFWALDTANGAIWALPGLGRGGWETAVQVDTGSMNTVGVLLMDDNTAPIYLWVGTKSSAADADFLERNGLAATSGNLFTWVPTATSLLGTDAGTVGVPDSADLKALELNTAATGSWQLVGSGEEVAALDENALRAEANALGALQLSRLEDASVNPLNGQQVVFATTGNSAFGGADTFGNLITLDFSGAFNADGEIGPVNGTDLRLIYDGDKGFDPSQITGSIDTDAERTYAASFGATIIRNPDNLTWSGDGLIYVQEDRSVDRNFFAQTEASIWSVDPTSFDAVTGQATSERWAQIDRSAVPPTQSDPNPADFGNWESSGIIDVSEFYSADAGTFFLADVQAHNLTSGNLAGSGYLVQGGQLDLIQQPPLI